MTVRIFPVYEFSKLKHATRDYNAENLVVRRFRTNVEKEDKTSLYLKIDRNLRQPGILSFPADKQIVIKLY